MLGFKGLFKLKVDQPVESSGQKLNTSKYTSGTSDTINNLETGDLLEILVKGNFTGNSGTTSIELTVAGQVRDKLDINTGNAGRIIPFALKFNYVTPDANDVSISVASLAGSIANVKISTQIFR